MPPTHSFKVSAALKSLIGRDLITNPYVAIFELVKNGFDADATRVDLHFGEGFLAVIDDGRGMSGQDIESKWLFVAFSEKKELGETPRTGSDRYTAGSKGVGRFAADQLGAHLELQSRGVNGTRVEVVTVKWDEFEQDQNHEFVDIPVKRRTQADFELPDECKAPKHGTVLLLRDLRQSWSRENLSRLRRYLSRLLDPFEDQGASFSIHLHAPAELARDATEQERFLQKGAEDDAPDIVNGRIETNLQRVLALGTTAIHVALDQSTNELVTTLTDRGELVYKMAEPNRWAELTRSAFDCRLYYLNRAAKHRFARRMGVSAVDFGSVFLFRNGFRVFPIGEVGDDFFRIDRRKQQGVRRYLGARDVIGRANVRGDGRNFVESTSRDQGLIQSAAVEELRDCFRETCLKRLEAYVVGVTWRDKGDKEEPTPVRMKAPEARERLVSVLAGLTRAEGARLFDVAPNLDELLASGLTRANETLAGLDEIAEHRKDPKLKSAVKEARSRLKELARARERAEQERDEAYAAAERAELERRQAEERAETGRAALENEKQRSLFLEASAPIDVPVLQALMHQIGIQASDAGVAIKNALRSIQRKPLDLERVESILTNVAWRVEQVQVVTRFATRANFRMDAQDTTADVAQFMRQYLERVSAVYHDVEIKLKGATDSFVRSFRPIDLSIAMDNLVSNARRANATEISFDLAVSTTRGVPDLTATVSDDGRGLHPSIDDPNRLFERGFTTTDGSGLGLWHLKRALSDMRATIVATVGSDRQLTFVIRIPK